MNYQNILPSIIATKPIYHEEDVNRWLKTGWILLSIRTDSHTEPDGELSHFYALVGWSRNVGDSPNNPSPKIGTSPRGKIVFIEEKWDEWPHEN